MLTTSDHLDCRSVADTVVKFVGIVFPMLGFVVGLVLAVRTDSVTWIYVLLLFTGWLFTGLGVTVGFHRLITHRSFETYPWVRAFWVVVGCMALQGSPLVWCAWHRRHHEREDHVGDPHSPQHVVEGLYNKLRGILYAHVGWMISRRWIRPEPNRYAQDFLADPMLMTINRWHGLWLLLGFAIPTAIGGLYEMSWRGALLGFVWGGLVRVFVTHHVIWSVNSICHSFGRRPYRTTGRAGNVAIIGILALGEGWHNNHHAFPTSARHGFEPWQLDLGWITIRMMELVGLAWNLRLPSPRRLARKRIP